jgi:hypothetical protein
MLNPTLTVFMDKKGVFGGQRQYLSSLPASAYAYDEEARDPKQHCYDIKGYPSVRSRRFNFS